jgi:hypothetical protein
MRRRYSAVDSLKTKLSQNLDVLVDGTVHGQSETTVFDLVMKVLFTQCGGQSDTTVVYLVMKVLLTQCSCQADTTTSDLNIDMTI